MSLRAVPRRAAAIVACAILVSALPAPAQEVLGRTGVSGAGSTFVYPLLSQWSREHRAQSARGGDFPAPNAGLEDPSASTALEYEPVGSLGGILRVKDRAVDFAASDMPLDARELAASGLAQFPLVLGGIVVAVNIAGVAPGEMKLTGVVLADIFLGKITTWSHPAIKALNPSLNVPDAPIAVIRRADGSGTTFNFADYLSRVSAAWKEQMGAGLLLKWPIGTPAKGNEGVAQAVRQTSNAIGYVEYAQALQAKLSYALVQNRAGRYVTPNVTSFQAAAASADWKNASDFYVRLADAPGEHAYPLTATVFVLVHKSAWRARVRATLGFFQWSLEKGSETALRLGYAPLPAPLVVQVKSYWTRTFNAGG